jgi:hypothetical protein
MKMKTEAFLCPLNVSWRLDGMERSEAEAPSSTLVHTDGEKKNTFLFSIRQCFVKLIK